MVHPHDDGVAASDPLNQARTIESTVIGPEIRRIKLGPRKKKSPSPTAKLGAPTLVRIFLLLVATTHLMYERDLVIPDAADDARARGMAPNPAGTPPKTEAVAQVGSCADRPGVGNGSL